MTAFSELFERRAREVRKARGEEAVTKSVKSSHSIYGSDRQAQPGRTSTDGAPVSPYGDGAPPGVQDLPPAQQAAGEIPNGPYPSISPYLLEARDIANHPSFNTAHPGGNRALQTAYPGPGRTPTNPTVTADANEMVEGIDLTAPGTLLPKLYQRYGGPALPKLHPSEAARLAVHPGLPPAFRRLAARRARNGKR